jgi:hypothetical protein
MYTDTRYFRVLRDGAILTQQVSRPPDQPQQHTTQTVSAQGQKFTRRWIIVMLALITIVLLGFAALIVRNIPLLIKQATPVSGSRNPLQPSHLNQGATLNLAGNQYVVFEQGGVMYVVSALDGRHVPITAPGYSYSRSTPPHLTPAGKLVYSGDGVWMTDIFTGNAQQIAPLPSDQVITSMVLNADGTQVAWSTAPQNGAGMTRLYIASLNALGKATLIYQQSAIQCPCFRIFSFAPTNSQATHTTLLLTDDRGDHGQVASGLWSLDVSSALPSAPQQLLNEARLQMPLSLADGKNVLLFSDQGGFVPAPEDYSAPGDITALTYPNSLSLALLHDNGSTSSLTATRTILPAQRQLNDSSDYHWVLSPRFSPDGHTLVYVVFSSNAQYPFIRRSSLYTVQFTGNGTMLHNGQPSVLATTSSRFIELGVWVNDHVLTFYSDGFLYAFDTNTGAVTTITHTGLYAHIVAVVNRE